MASFATVAEFAARLPGPLLADEELRAEAVLEDVSAIVADLVDGDTAQQWSENGAPASVVAVVCSASHRAMVNPLQHASVTEGSYTWRADNVSGVWLTPDEKSTVRRAAGIPGWSSVEKTTEYGFERWDVPYTWGI